MDSSKGSTPSPGCSTDDGLAAALGQSFDLEHHLATHDEADGLDNAAPEGESALPIVAVVVAAPGQQPGAAIGPRDVITNCHVDMPQFPAPTSTGAPSSTRAFGGSAISTRNGGAVGCR